MRHKTRTESPTMVTLKAVSLAALFFLTLLPRHVRAEPRAIVIDPSPPPAQAAPSAEPLVIQVRREAKSTDDAASPSSPSPSPSPKSASAAPAEEHHPEKVRSTEPSSASKSARSHSGTSSKRSKRPRLLPVDG
jgi:hypothetical protein